MGVNTGNTRCSRCCSCWWWRRWWWWRRRTRWAMKTRCSWWYRANSAAFATFARKLDSWRQQYSLRFRQLLWGRMQETPGAPGVSAPAPIAIAAPGGGGRGRRDGRRRKGAAGGGAGQSLPRSPPLHGSWIRRERRVSRKSGIHFYGSERGESPVVPLLL